MPIVFVGILRCGFAVCLVAGLVCEARVVEFRLLSWIALFAVLVMVAAYALTLAACWMLSSARMIRGMLMMSAVAVSMAVPTHHRMMLRLLGAFLCRGLLCGGIAMCCLLSDVG